MPNFYFILDSMVFALILLALVFLFGVIYTFTGKYLYSKALTNLHLGLTMISLLVLSGLPIYRAFRELQTESFTYFASTHPGDGRIREITLLIFVLSQFLFIVNLVAGFVYKLSSKYNPKMPHY